MLNTVERYLVLRRAAGFAMQSAECLLKSFASFAAERGETHVRAQTAIDWAAFGPSVAQRDARLKAVCRFARAIRIEDDRHQEPPANYFGARKKRRPPHIYSALWLGHANLATTEVYTRGDPTEKLEAIEAIVPPHLRRGVFRPPDKLIALLKGAS